MKYDFDEVVDRSDSDSVKYDYRNLLFGKSDVLPFWVADMDFKTPDFIIEALKKRLDHEILGYTSLPEGLKEVIAGWLIRQHQWEVQPDWITINPGVVPTLAFCVLAYTKPGDQVIVQPPVYFPFFYVIENNGRKIVHNPLQLQQGRYFMDFTDLKRKINSRTRMILLCNPHNPGGSVWKREELSELAAICRKHQILIISDEIHSDLMLFGNKHIPVASLDQEIAANTVTCLSSSKTFNTAGLAISYTVIPDQQLRYDLANMLRDFHLSHGNISGLMALEAAYRHGKDWLRQIIQYLEDNIDWLEGFLKNRLPAIRMIKPEGTFLVWLDFSELGLSQKDLNRFLIHQAGIGLSDGELFGPGGQGFQRINIACPRSFLMKGMEQMEGAFNDRNNEKES
ncbi:MAG: PatB family C-S lyase [Cyclobacteriaceae bacterium]|nr:PatB family C-S lyase [Cyclobacteriaceae bacterium]